jgi:hypothetical protein
MTNCEHLQRFQNLLDVLATACNGQLHDQALVNLVTERHQAGAACDNLAAKEEKKTVQTSSAKLHLAVMFIHQSDRC